MFVAFEFQNHLFRTRDQSRNQSMMVRHRRLRSRTGIPDYLQLHDVRTQSNQPTPILVYSGSHSGILGQSSGLRRIRRSFQRLRLAIRIHRIQLGHRLKTVRSCQPSQHRHPNHSLYRTIDFGVCIHGRHRGNRRQRILDRLMGKPTQWVERTEHRL